MGNPFSKPKQADNSALLAAQERAAKAQEEAAKTAAEKAAKAEADLAAQKAAEEEAARYRKEKQRGKVATILTGTDTSGVRTTLGG